MNAERGDGGFTLVETLVALFVVALLATSGGALLISALRASDAVSSSSDRVRQLEVMHATLRSDLMAMSWRGSRGPDEYGTPQGPIGMDGSNEGMVMAFARTGWPRLDPADDVRSDVQRVEYHFREGALVRMAYMAGDPNSETPVIEQVLASGVTRLQLRYARQGSWQEEWRTGRAQPSGTLPDSVEVALSLDGGRTLVQRFHVGGGA